MKAWGFRCIEDGYRGQGIDCIKGEWHHYEFDTKEEAEAAFVDFQARDWGKWEVAPRTPEERIESLTAQLKTAREASRNLAERNIELRAQLRELQKREIK